jgi:hypothetical protein
MLCGNKLSFPEVKHLISQFIFEYNNYIIDFYCKYFYHDKQDFNGSLNKIEKGLLIECIIEILENIEIKTKYTYIDIIKAIIYYYYHCMILEYYIADNIDYNCDKIFLEGTKAREIADKITISDNLWASNIRRKINNL